MGRRYGRDGGEELEGIRPKSKSHGLIARSGCQRFAEHVMAGGESSVASRLDTSEKWHAYEDAVEDMLVKTSTSTAPWWLVEGNDKYWARAKVLSRLVQILSTELEHEPADPLRRGKKKGRKKLQAGRGDPRRWSLRGLLGWFRVQPQ